MVQNPLPNRRSIRLKGYDYSTPGAYFVTICTYRRACLFGQISNDQMVLSPIGEIAQQEWLQLPARFPSITMDEFVVMPNHTHAIIVIHDRCEAFSSPTDYSLAAIIGAYKTSVTVKANIYFDQRGISLWQRNYWDHVIRDESEFNTIRQYIQTNPARWLEDRLAPGSLQEA